MSRIKDLPYSEGTWIAIPLRTDGYGVGRIARHTLDGGLVVYFFPVKSDAVPTLSAVEHLTPQDAILVGRVGDLGILEHKWPILGNSVAWTRSEWPIPRFIRRDELMKIAWVISYDDNAPDRVICEERVPYETTGFYQNGFYGYGAAEIVLTKLLK